jgi:hypothetical protein
MHNLSLCTSHILDLRYCLLEHSVILRCNWAAAVSLILCIHAVTFVAFLFPLLVFGLTQVPLKKNSTHMQVGIVPDFAEFRYDKNEAKASTSTRRVLASSSKNSSPDKF